MSKLIYITNASLDGYIEDKAGNFDWGNPEQVFDFITDLLRPIGTHLLGRRLAETMAYWDAAVIEDYPAEQRDFAKIWQSAEKIVFSRASRDFDVEAVGKLKRESKHDLMIGGAEIASLAFEADLLDEYHLFIHPVVVGGGKPALRTAARRHLELLETRRFDTGVIHVRYRVQSSK